MLKETALINKNVSLKIVINQGPVQSKSDASLHNILEYIIYNLSPVFKKKIPL